MKAVICGVTTVVLGATIPALANGPDLGWLGGHWCTGAGPDRTEEFWLPPRGGQTVGLGRTTAGGAMSGFEYLRIVIVQGALTYVAQPGGGPATRFAATGHGAGWIEFANPEHDFPQRIRYERHGAELRAAIAGPGPDGETMTIPFEYRPCD